MDHLWLSRTHSGPCKGGAGVKCIQLYVANMILYNCMFVYYYNNGRQLVVCTVHGTNPSIRVPWDVRYIIIREVYKATHMYPWNEDTSFNQVSGTEEIVGIFFMHKQKNLIFWISCMQDWHLLACKRGQWQGWQRWGGGVRAGRTLTGSSWYQLSLGTEWMTSGYVHEPYVYIIVSCRNRRNCLVSIGSEIVHCIAILLILGTVVQI